MTTNTNVRTTSIRTLDDLHESNLQELVEYANANPAAVPGVFVGGGFSEEMLAKRRQAVREFDRETAPRVKDAWRTVDSTPWLLLWLPRPRRALIDLLRFIVAVLSKIETEDRYAELEQFGPIKRAANDAFRD